MTTPTVTIVIVPRERFTHAVQSLDSVYRNTNGSFKLVYVDGNSPATVRDHLKRAAAERGFRLIRVDRFLSPNQARNLALKEVTTPYVVFLDNDVEVSAGWLTHLVKCAEETGAWAVAPVYFEGAASDRIIHMAGGDAEFSEQDGRRTFHEEHVMNGVHFDDVAPTLRQAPTGFFEFHGVLLRREVLERLGPLDERLLSLHEHMDLSLRIRQSGGAVYLAPGAQVTYTFGLLDADDLAYCRYRWSEEWNRDSTLHFARKWDINETDPWVASSINWGNNHREHMERMRRSPTSMAKQMARRFLPAPVYSALRALRQ